MTGQPERILSGEVRPARPYTPQSLADQWGCSPEKVRRMLHDGTLASFRIGKLIRIPAAAVEEYECRMLIESSATEGGSALRTPTRSEAAFESRLARVTEASPKLALVRGGPGTAQPQPSE
jgi:excisionase family DNA binding protein